MNINIKINKRNPKIPVLDNSLIIRSSEVIDPKPAPKKGRALKASRLSVTVASLAKKESDESFPKNIKSKKDANC